ncbi:hypothetical protein GmHk_02G004646 [Glycine max]|uniref:uncharacterized protein n=1 Tax=Glycine max TaxID=3847 RepID=UPI0003DE9223|nr:uncharacterized protein LOC102663846 [Glycine max]KAH1261894.1 hypothetical protein GmHk_02G004646 [Glycine max]|eukprot:XP_006575985.1 uncharacterized protein LOC102663846 [Glycine max]
MAGRNDRAIVDALQALAQAMGNQNRGEVVGDAEYQGLDRFQQNNPSAFNGGCNPDGAQNWTREIEKIFRVMACLEGQKVAFGTYTLVEEAEYWWENTRQCLEAKGQVVTWEVFKRVFLEKYFSEDIRNKKEMEFLELKQGNIIVVEYAAKFKEMVRYFPHYQGRDSGSSKCVKFLNGLRLKASCELLIGLLASVPIVIVGFRSIKEFVSRGT